MTLRGGLLIADMWRHSIENRYNLQYAESAELFAACSQQSITWIALPIPSPRFGPLFPDSTRRFLPPAARGASPPRTLVSEHSTVPMVAGEARFLGVWVGVRYRNRF